MVKSTVIALETTVLEAVKDLIDSVSTDGTEILKIRHEAGCGCQLCRSVTLSSAAPTVLNFRRVGDLISSLTEMAGIAWEANASTDNLASWNDIRTQMYWDTKIREMLEARGDIVAWMSPPPAQDEGNYALPEHCRFIRSDDTDRIDRVEVKCSMDITAYLTTRIRAFDVDDDTLVCGMTKAGDIDSEFTDVTSLVDSLIGIARRRWDMCAPRNTRDNHPATAFNQVEWDAKIRGLLDAEPHIVAWGNTPTLQKGKNQKLLIYIMSDGGDHPFLVMRRTEQNAKGKYVTREEFLKVGLCWPNSFVADRDDMALKLGRAILDEAGV